MKLVLVVSTMATLRQYFDTDFSRLLKSSHTFRLCGGAAELEVPVNLHYDFDANAKFVSCLITKSGNTLSACNALLTNVDKLLSVGDNVGVRHGFVGERPMDGKTLRFCGRVFLYCEEDLPAPELECLRLEAEANGILLQIRGPRFAQERARLETPVAFISYDSRDKDEVARPIAVELSKLMCPVWYDEFSLRLGDPLRESIETGLKQCKRCILVLSKNFLSNRGWTKFEFNAVFTREILEGANLVLPIWCGIESSDLYDYSPTLVSRRGVKWELGLEEVVRQIHRALV